MLPLRTALSPILLAAAMMLPATSVAASSTAEPWPERPASFVVNEEDALSNADQMEIEAYLAGVNEGHEENVYVYVRPRQQGIDQEGEAVRSAWEMSEADVLLLVSTEDALVALDPGSENSERITEDEDLAIEVAAMEGVVAGRTRVAINTAITSVFYELEDVSPTEGVEMHDHEDGEGHEGEAGPVETLTEEQAAEASREAAEASAAETGAAAAEEDAREETSAEVTDTVTDVEGWSLATFGWVLLGVVLLAGGYYLYLRQKSRHDEAVAEDAGPSPAGYSEDR